MWRGASRSKAGNFAELRVSPDNFRGITHFFERTIDEFAIGHAHLIPRHFQRGHDHLLDQFRILVRTPIADEIFYPRIKWRINCPQTSRRLIVNCSPSKIFHAEHLTLAALSPRDFSAGGIRSPRRLVSKN